MVMFPGCPLKLRTVYGTVTFIHAVLSELYAVFDSIFKCSVLIGSPFTASYKDSFNSTGGPLKHGLHAVVDSHVWPSAGSTIGALYTPSELVFSKHSSFQRFD